MLLFLRQFTFFLIFILLTGYLLPAGQFYLRFYVFTSETSHRRRIQRRTASRADVIHEIKYSLITVLIFATFATFLWRLYQAGGTSIYLSFAEHPWYYHPLSFTILLLFHDTYFYWTHRLMHWRPIFKYVHLGHHKSLTPTPWAIFSFQPLEAVIQFGIVALPVIFLPLHPVVLLVYLSYDSFINTAGHSGHEIFPTRLTTVWPFNWLNTVAHHDYHHTNVRVNYGAFFNIWDRLMGTFFDAQPAAASHDQQNDGATLAQSDYVAIRK
jgi:sterol desaturase/sphingolipid hydroxylase (fatty acid hydroxylase superfamily)